MIWDTCMFPRNILDQTEGVTPENHQVIQECRRKGFQLLYPETNQYMLNSEVFNIIQQAHTIMAARTKEDLEGKRFSSSAHILAVADMFDQLTAMNLHHTPISEVAAIRYLKKFNWLYDSKSVSALANCIHILPKGCSIDLTNGDKGIVLVENPENFAAPVILNIRDNQIYDLSNPQVAQKVQISDIMKTMDNRIVIDEETLKHFSSDSKLQDTLSRYQKKMAQKGIQ